MSLRDDLLTLERAFWTGGAESYRRQLDDECLMAFTGMTGVFGRQAIVETIAGGPRWGEPQIEVRGLLQPTPEVALLCYQATAERDGQAPYRALVSSGYVARDGSWKLAFHQQTPLGDNDAFGSP